jgi:hypothetical protein
VLDAGTRCRPTVEGGVASKGAGKRAPPDSNEGIAHAAGAASVTIWDV